MIVINVKNKGIKSLPELSGKEDINKKLLFYFTYDEPGFSIPRPSISHPNILNPHILTSSPATVRFLPVEQPEC